MNPFQLPTLAAPSPFSGGHRLGRACWQLCWLVLFRLSPRPCHAWRAWLLRRFGASIGRHCHIYPLARIWAPWNLVCQDHACVGDHAILYNQAMIRLGAHAVVSQGAHLCTGTHDYQSPGFDLVVRSIAVEDHAWLSAECFLLPGVTIGAGAVIGARAVVTKDMPAWMVCAGHPCVPIKPRFPRQSALSA